DDRRLDLQLTRIRDRRVHAAAAQRITRRISAVRRTIRDLDRRRIRDTFRHTIHDRRDRFAGNGAGDQNDLALDAGDHPSTGRWFVDGKRYDGAWADHQNAIV